MKQTGDCCFTLTVDLFIRNYQKLKCHCCKIFLFLRLVQALKYNVLYIFFTCSVEGFSAYIILYTKTLFLNLLLKKSCSHHAFLLVDTLIRYKDLPILTLLLLLYPIYIYVRYSNIWTYIIIYEILDTLIYIYFWFLTRRRFSVTK